MPTMSKRVMPLATTAVLMIVLSACGSSVSDAGDAETDVSAPPSKTSDEAPAQGDGKYAFGTDRDQIAAAIEGGFKSSNGKARWEGDTLVLAVDGSINSMMPGYTECRVLSELLEPEDLSEIEYPDGRIACVDALAEE